MNKLSPAGEQTIDQLAARYGFSREAVTTMLESLARGRGGMAQFDHPEFGGSGQWMRGGMTMVSDMFNDALKSRVAALCADLATLLARDASTMLGGSFQHQSQSEPGAARPDDERDAAAPAPVSL